MARELRVPLSRERILQAAVELADGSGVEAVTMRRLGDELGFEAMSLYRHVANKDDLLDGMLDIVLAEWQPPDGDADWGDAVKASARSVHDSLRRHPWAARLLTTSARLPPARISYMNSLLGRLRDAGFAADRTYSVYHVLDGYIFGYSLWEIAYTTVADEVRGRVAELMATIPWEEYTHLAEHRDQHMSEGPHKEVNSFELGLDLILDGLQKSLR